MSKELLNSELFQVFKMRELVDLYAKPMTKQALALKGKLSDILYNSCTYRKVDILQVGKTMRINLAKHKAIRTH